MKVLAIKNFPEEVKGRLKALAALRGMSIKDLVISMVEQETQFWELFNADVDAVIKDTPEEKEAN